MEISWFGRSCFQIRGKKVTLITDPFSPEFAEGQHDGPLQSSKINPTIVTISHDHPGHCYVQGVGGNPRVVKGPGEYEINDVLITGIAAYHDNTQGRERGHNTIYVIHIDDIVVCHLGDLGHSLQEQQLEEAADADILLVPIGGQCTLTANQATEVISQIEPHIIIPMHYHPLAEETSETLDPLNIFCREMGVEQMNVQQKLVVTHNNLPTVTQVVVLSQWS